MMTGAYESTLRGVAATIRARSHFEYKIDVVQRLVNRTGLVGSLGSRHLLCTSQALEDAAKHSSCQKHGTCPLFSLASFLLQAFGNSPWAANQFTAPVRKCRLTIPTSRAISSLPDYGDPHCRIAPRETLGRRT